MRFTERECLEREGYALRTDSDTEEIFPEAREEIVVASPRTVRRQARERGISIYGGPVRDDRGDPFPNAWPFWCGHCSHPFEGAPFGIPVKYDEKRDIYYCIGRFCSDRCAKAVLIEKGWHTGRIGGYFASMVRRAYGKGWDYCTPTAPPRSRLQVYGGDLSIETFREHPDRFVCRRVPSNVLVETEQLAEMERTQQDRERQERLRRQQEGRRLPVAPHVPRRESAQPPRRRVMQRQQPVPLSTYTLDTFWNKKRSHAS